MDLRRIERRSGVSRLAGLHTVETNLGPSCLYFYRRGGFRAIGSIYSATLVCRLCLQPYTSHTYIRACSEAVPRDWRASRTDLFYFLPQPCVLRCAHHATLVWQQRTRRIRIWFSSTRFVSRASWEGI